MDEFDALKNAYNSLLDKAFRLKNEEEQCITLGFSGTALRSFAMYLSDDLATFNGRTIHKISADDDKVFQLLRSSYVDFALTHFVDPGGDISSIQLLSEEIVIVASSNHPLLEMAPCRKSDLENYSFFGRYRDHYFRHLCDVLCQKSNVKINYAKEENYRDYYRSVNEHRGSDDFLTFSYRSFVPSTFGIPDTEEGNSEADDNDICGYKILRVKDMSLYDGTHLSWLRESNNDSHYKGFVEYIANHIKEHTDTTVALSQNLGDIFS